MVQSMTMTDTEKARMRLLDAFRQIQDRAHAASIPVRITGSIAVQLRCPESASRAARGRHFADIDLVAYKRDAARLRPLIETLGYTEHRDVFAVSEGGRAIFDHPHTAAHVDVFFDRLDFCHCIMVRNRLEIHEATLPLAELLLGKLQIVEINEKDLRDATALLLDHEVGFDDTGINSAHIAALCAADWGLWRTVRLNLDKLSQYAAHHGDLSTKEARLASLRLARLNTMIDAEPKPLKWRMRARIGDRLKWYKDVEEVD